MLMFIKVYSFNKLYLKQKVFVASLISGSLSLDRISVNFRKTCRKLYGYPAGVNLCASWMQILFSSIGPRTPRPMRYIFVSCHTYATLRVGVA